MNMWYIHADGQGVSGSLVRPDHTSKWSAPMANAQDARAADAAQWATCRHCGVTKPPEDFYPHPAAASGRDSACKECRKALVRKNREAKADYYRAYDRKRYRDDPERKENAKRCGASMPMECRIAEQRERRRREPEKSKARRAVAYALKAGKIERSPCFFCGSEKNLHAHHEDYDHPLDVVLLCSSCHGKLHIIKGDFRRAAP